MTPSCSAEIRWDARLLAIRAAIVRHLGTGRAARMGGKILKPRSGRAVDEREVDYAIWTNISCVPQDVVTTEALDLTAPAPVEVVKPVEYLPYIPDDMRPGERCEAFLRRMLSRGEQSAVVIERAAEKLGLDKSTLARTKKKMGVESHKAGRVWFWRLA
jgi:hypothetical protein